MNRTISTIAVVALIALSKKTTGPVYHLYEDGSWVKGTESGCLTGKACDDTSAGTHGLYFRGTDGTVIWIEQIGWNADIYCDEDGERPGCSIGNPIIR